MHRSTAIANEFLRRAGPGGLTQMQLQKLAYFSHGWMLALGNQPLISEDVEAWTYGPVYPDLYEHTKFFGKAPIDRLITPDDDEAARFFGRSREKKEPYKAALSDYERQLIDAVWMRYGKLGGARLSALTHQPATPWFQTFEAGRNVKIDNQVIKRHYDDIARKAKIRRDAATAA